MLVSDPVVTELLDRRDAWAETGIDVSEFPDPADYRDTASFVQAFNEWFEQNIVW